MLGESRKRGDWLSLELQEKLPTSCGRGWETHRCLVGREGKGEKQRWAWARPRTSTRKNHPLTKKPVDFTDWGPSIAHWWGIFSGQDGVLSNQVRIRSEQLKVWHWDPAEDLSYSADHLCRSDAWCRRVCRDCVSLSAVNEWYVYKHRDALRGWHLQNYQPVIPHTETSFKLKAVPNYFKNIPHAEKEKFGVMETRSRWRKRNSHLEE